MKTNEILTLKMTGKLFVVFSFVVMSLYGGHETGFSMYCRRGLSSSHLRGHNAIVDQKLITDPLPKEHSP